ncbi:maleylpyruvate isomerase family mycothiol-dependent enzyme [Streptomyces monashensis]|uniref:maleylpyruvate isomerase family mycothiol-dependent enzyme n=1 Tax=Streptomyces monashensis TaxID=1678012 RepID=UPI0033D6CE1F
MRVQVNGFPATGADDPLGLVARSADRLVRSAGALSDAALRAPSELPGWTRGHVLAHVAHSADAYVRLLGLARTGREPGPRADRAALAAALERDAALPAGRLTALLRESLDRFTAQARTMPAPAWDHLVAALAGWRHPARYLLLRCLRELETHHLDIGTGYGTEQWPGAYVSWALDDTLGTLRAQGFALASVEAVDLGRRWTLAAQGPSVTAAGHRILGWLTGRLPAEALATDPLPADALPTDAPPADALMADAPIARVPAHLLPRPPAWPQPPLPGWGRVGDDA